jgi:hypothetical protein
MLGFDFNVICNMCRCSFIIGGRTFFMISNITHYGCIQHGLFIILVGFVIQNKLCLLFCCCNPSLGLATKARAFKGAGQEWSLVVTFHVFGSVEGCEEMNPRTFKWAPTLGIESQWTFKFSESDRRGENSLDWKIPYTIEKILKHRCLKWACTSHLSI